MNICVKCRHHKLDGGSVSTGMFSLYINEHYCYSPGVCEEHQKPATGIPSKKLCSEANENGECKHWEEGEMVALREFEQEKNRWTKTIALQDEEIGQLMDRIVRLKRRWWRRGT